MGGVLIYTWLIANEKMQVNKNELGFTKVASTSETVLTMIKI